MKEFNFKLESVLDYRKTTEKEKVQSYVKKKQEFEQEQSNLEKLEKTYAKNISDITDGATGKMDFEKQMQYYRYLENTKHKIKNQKKVIHEKTEKLNQAEEELIEAKKEVKIMEKLKTKKKEEYEQEQRKVEQNTLDEFATMSFTRKRIE
jgi:flagellar FliJ protein